MAFETVTANSLRRDPCGYFQGDIRISMGVGWNEDREKGPYKYSVSSKFCLCFHPESKLQAPFLSQSCFPQRHEQMWCVFVSFQFRTEPPPESDSDSF